MKGRVRVRVRVYGLGFTGLRGTGHGIRVTGYGLRVTVRRVYGLGFVV